MVKKLFCIGLTKTGTTSFNKLASIVGYKTCGFKFDLLREAIQVGGIGPKIQSYLDNYDAFDDWPWPLIYKELLEKYHDDAYFVLTKRKSAEVWLNSIKQYSLNTKTQRIRRLTYGTNYPHGFEEQYLRTYHTHLENVREHFMKHSMMDKLIEVEIGDPRLAKLMLKNRGLEEKEIPIPHANKTVVKQRIYEANLKQVNTILRIMGKEEVSPK